jgi:hypothetical protein
VIPADVINGNLESAGHVENAKYFFYKNVFSACHGVYAISCNTKDLMELAKASL